MSIGGTGRARRGQVQYQMPPLAQGVSLIESLVKNFRKAIEWTPPDSTNSKSWMAYLVCCISSLSQQLFDDRKQLYHLVLAKFYSTGAQHAFFKLFDSVMAVLTKDTGGAITKPVPEGLNEFLEAWLTLVEKISNPTSVMESQYHLAEVAGPASVTFNPTKYLVATQKMAFDHVAVTWNELFDANNRVSELVLNILCHIVRAEPIIQKELRKKEKSGTEKKGPEEERMEMEQQVNSDHLQQLIGMGFQRELAIEALLSSPNVEQAAEFCVMVPALRAQTARNWDRSSRKINFTMTACILNLLAVSCWSNLWTMRTPMAICTVTTSGVMDLALCFADMRVFSGETATSLFVSHTVSLAPVFIFGSGFVITLFEFFIPIMGRDGTVSNPELKIGGLSALCSTFIVLYMGGLTCVSNPFGGFIRKTAKTIAIMYALLVLAVAFTPLFAPYGYSPIAPRLRRIRLQHVTKTTIMANGETNCQNGIMVTPNDYRGESDLPAGIFTAGHKKFSCVAEDKFCLLPYFDPTDQMNPPTTIAWTSAANEPRFEIPLKLTLTRRQILMNKMIQLDFSIIGSDHSAVYLTPLTNWTIHRWSFTEGPIHKRHGYFVRISSIGQPNRFRFSIMLKPTSDSSWICHEGPKVIVGVSSSHIHGKNRMTESLQLILGKIHSRGRLPNPSFWRFAMTAEVFSTEYIAHYYE